MENKIEMPQDLKEFIDSSQWVWAKTYEKFAPHWYVVRNPKNNEMFLKFVVFLRENGVVRRWYKRIGLYLDYKDRKSTRLNSSH